MAAQQLLGRTCGVFGEPAGVTGAAGVKKLCEQGVIGKDDTVVSGHDNAASKGRASHKAGWRTHLHPFRHGLPAGGLCEKGITVE